VGERKLHAKTVAQQALDHVQFRQIELCAVFDQINGLADSTNGKAGWRCEIFSRGG
jgi:hypothetical protein